MSNNKLNDKDLQIVSAGGAGGGTPTRKIGKYVFSGHVGKYNAKVNTLYFITEDGSEQWWMGVLLKTWEESKFIFFTKRMHRFNIMLYCGSPHDTYADFDGDRVTLYTQCSGL